QSNIESHTSDIENEILYLVNEYRMSKGLISLEFDAETYDFALAHNAYMISEGNISHDNFKQRSSKLAVNVGAGYVSENIGKNFVTAQALVGAWKESHSHQKNMVGDFTHFAVSATSDSNGILYFTNLFFK
ncbi:hypothetical protein LCGC14_1599570, partial [marine sediment metagenome]